MMQKYLLFDSGCTVCSNLANEVESASQGALSARSLTDTQMQELLDKARPGWSWEPTLLEVGDDQSKVFTGVSMRVRLFNTLGPRRSWRIARIVARAQGEPQATGTTRKDFVKQAGSAVAGITGLAVFGASPAIAKERSQSESGGQHFAPGHYARREGVKAYNSGIEVTGSSVQVPFTHADPAKSGTLIAQEISGSRSSFQLVRNGDIVVASVFDKSNGWCDINDGSGRNAHFVFTEHGVRPETDDVIEYNREDLSIGAAIQHDLEERLAPKPEFQTQVAQSCNCDVTTTISGQANDTSRSLACRAATSNANYNCTNCSCYGCCSFVSSVCSCSCLVGDFFCGCTRYGYPCYPNCFPGCR